MTKEAFLCASVVKRLSCLGKTFSRPGFILISPQHMASSDKSATQARRFVVRGRVQGVGFRWFVEREAHILGIAGWVRNNSDGTVEVLAMGTRDQLSGLRSRLREGPRAARVDDVQESEAQPVAGLGTFRIEGAW